MDHVHNHTTTHILTIYVEDDEVQIPLDRPDALTADLAEDYARRIKGDAGIWGATDDGYVIVPARAIRYMELAEVAKVDAGDCEDPEADLTTLSGGVAGQPPHMVAPAQAVDALPRAPYDDFDPQPVSVDAA